MEVHTLGEGTPELAIVGGIHGDEPCGVRAIERLLAEDPAVTSPVKLVIANEPALDRGVRYLEADLNRSFPGDPSSEAYERRLAAELAAELEGCRVLALHSTKSQADPFALVERIDDYARLTVPYLSVMAAVEAAPFVQGRIYASVQAIEVECGLQGSEQAAENATRIAREFLVATGALPGDLVRKELPVFRLTRQLPKPPGKSYSVRVANFERVDAGQAYAAANGEEYVADESFYPVLCSADGYEDVFGYAAERVGEI